MMSDVVLFDPTQLFLEFDATTANGAWLKSQQVLTPASRWQTYLNRLCEMVFLPWLKQEQSQQPIQAEPHLTNCAELFNGTAIEIGNRRLILVPSEASDLSEIRVPIEWVDIPDLVGDYYLATQVNLDDGYIRVWGYTTHQQLKTNGIYSQSDRSYSLTEEHLINDINVLVLAIELCPTEVTQVALNPIPTIPATQAENLIQRLGSSQVLVPRCAIPFTTWASLIQNDSWCKSLSQKRRGLPDRGSFVQWLQTGIDKIAEEIGWREIEFQPSVVGARGVTLASEDETTLTKPAFARQINIAEIPYELKILPLDVEAGIWGFELRSLLLGGNIPPGFKLELLTEELEPFEGNTDIATTAVEKLYLEVELESGEGLVLVIEPTPNEYQPEILRF